LAQALSTVLDAYLMIGDGPVQGGERPHVTMTVDFDVLRRQVGDATLTAAGTPVGSSRTQLRLPPPAPSSVEILGEGPDAAPAIVDLFEKLGVR